MMKFTVSEKKKHSDVEKDMIKYWKENGTFEKSVEQRPKDNAWVFMMVLRLLLVCHITVICSFYSERFGC
jgi:hypothetical protein